MNTQKSQQNDQQGKSQRSDNPEWGDRNRPSQSSGDPNSPSHPGARQSVPAGASESSARDNDAPKASQRGQASNQQGTIATPDKSPDMDESGDQSSERLRRGALDAQYGTDSSLKTGERDSQSQGTQSPTGSDRDTMGGSR